MEQTNDDIGINTDNNNDNQIIYIDNSQELTINTSENDEKSRKQCSQETAINEDNNTTIGLRNKRSSYDIPKDNITTLKTDMIAMKN